MFYHAYVVPVQKCLSEFCLFLPLWGRLTGMPEWFEGVQKTGYSVVMIPTIQLHLLTPCLEQQRRISTLRCEK
jgi:hypothetical protein